ncbi:MAG: 4Fe-4S dicluster domain-containing protein, partial [Planctomycetes bacterium]|nr:4Fe-4S dicluster domain-containing protein [Planctomycetota bacterium]
MNKMDQDNADFTRTMSAITEAFGRRCVPIQIPSADGSIVDLLHPGDGGPAVDDARERLMEAIAETNDDLTNKFLDSGELSDQELIEGLKAGVASGDVVRLSAHQLTTNDDDTVLGPLVNGVSNILAQYDQQIRDRKPQSLVNCCGYRLDEVRQDGKIDLAQLFTGSEGTLGLITELTVATSPLPGQVGSVLLFFESIDKAAHAVQEILPLGPSACDLMDRRHLSLARESDPRYELLIPQVAEAVLLVEFSGESAEEVQERLERAVRLLQDKAKLASGAYVAADRYDHDMLWELARRYVPTLYRLKGSTRPVPMVEDIAVPPSALPDFLHSALQILKQEQVTASLFGHAGHGQLHIRPFLDLANDNDAHKLKVLAGRLYAEVWNVGGTISGEHGDGLSRTPYVEKQYGPLAGAFREIKELFDPEEILNPGKIVPLEVASPSDPLRRLSYPLLDTLEMETTDTLPATESQQPKTALQLDWRPEEMAHAARSCNGCAACRTVSADTRMCPIFRYAPREEASPRAKANLARGMLTGTLPAGMVVEDACKQIADLCVHCHMCRLECPAQVDIPKLMVEAKAAYVATNNEPLFDWILTRIDRLCAIASRFSRLANWAIANRVARWVIEKTMGIAQGRKLPRFSSRPFLQHSTQRRLNRPQRSSGEKVLYFVDTYANYCDTQLAEALVAILEHNGISVYVPDRQQQAAMPMISRGVLEPARRVAEANVGMLAEAVRQGYTIVATEPSAVLALTHEYPILLPGDDDAALVAENAYEACHYLWRCHQRGQLELDFTPLTLTVGYH